MAVPDIVEELRWFLPEKDVTKLAWDIRPAPDAGVTLVRGCDIPSVVSDTMARAANEIETLRLLVDAASKPPTV